MPITIEKKYKKNKVNCFIHYHIICKICIPSHNMVFYIIVNKLLFLL